jgi:hypothetical protein
LREEPNARAMLSWPYHVVPGVTPPREIREAINLYHIHRRSLSLIMLLKGPVDIVEDQDRATELKVTQQRMALYADT